MRYEDWTFGEAEISLSEHSELRAGGGRSSHNPLRHELADWYAARRGTKE
jgi:hypothetical protein